MSNNNYWDIVLKHVENNKKYNIELLFYNVEQENTST